MRTVSIRLGPAARSDTAAVGISSSNRQLTPERSFVRSFVRRAHARRARGAESHLAQTIRATRPLVYRRAREHTASLGGSAITLDYRVIPVYAEWSNGETCRLGRESEDTGGPTVVYQNSWVPPPLPLFRISAVFPAALPDLASALMHSHHEKLERVSRRETFCIAAGRRVTARQHPNETGSAFSQGNAKRSREKRRITMPITMIAQFLKRVSASSRTSRCSNQSWGILVRGSMPA